MEGTGDSPPARAERIAAADAEWSLGTPARVVLAALSAGAGTIHLAMVSSHADAWLVEGIAFVVVGVLQLVFAVLVVLRPSELLVRCSCVANVGFIAAWVTSRVSGLPFGPERGHPHDASFVDITAVVLEALLVLIGYELLVRPDRGARFPAARRLASGVTSIAVLVVTVAAITSPSVADHAHDEHDHREQAAEAHDHDAGSSDAHAHGDAELAFLFPDGEDLGWAEISNGMAEHGGHRAAVPMDELNPRTRARLEHQLALTLGAVVAFPTVADAEAAGYRRTGEFNPGLGVHYGGGAPDLDGVISDDEIRRPGTLIYDGSQPDSPLAGFMFQTTSMSSEQPEGFAGPNDLWHSHTGVCIRFRPGGEIDALGSDGSISEEDCVARGYTYTDVTTSMVHVWTVPAYTNPVGVFAEANPALRCPDLTYHFSAACQRK